ncbi:Putative preQ0 transporter [Halorubrum sp. DM2]|uniref:queuosine precursor transporter n=1 Tax=Halorubrum sp. DM2 TaxID=2527867 RepID=UPI0024B82212|nr:queuosine precursor transporter [Halorubrum sp. DM2]VTT87266.1 Putative preQ0 transporter [Halorubrum sp. DM2]
MSSRTAGGEGGPFRTDPFDRSAVAAVGLITLFTVALATSQLTAAKVLALPLPVALPVVGPEITLPGAALAYALTFLASDCYAELYGRRATQVVVNVAFLANFLVLALVWSTLAAPGVDPEVSAAFQTALGPAANVVVGSLLAYVVSQNWDVFVFHAIRDRTGEGMLWLRNLASTATSQAIDTVIFVGVAFYAAPILLGVGSPLPGSVLLALGIGQYLLKLGIAVLDTPVVYLVVGAVRNRTP